MNKESYLHSHNIIHRGLGSESIFLDEHLYPKISGFENSIEIPQNLNGNDQIEGSSIKGTFRYLAPEVLSRLIYSKSSDVYAFSILIYEILTDERCFEEVKHMTDYISIVSEKALRPALDDYDIPNCYISLIKRCWSQDPVKRPSFDEIINELKTNNEFLTDKIDKDEFQNYVKFIEESQISFDQIISQISHPAIISFIGYIPVDFDNNPRPLILHHYYFESLKRNLSFGGLSSMFSDSTNYISTKKLIWIYGIASGMAFLHAHNILHRDLKSSNIYIDDNGFPRISGFDIAIQIEKELIYKSDKIKGTPAYLAPEVYLNKEYSKASDVYSFSLVMYEILSGNPAYEGKNSPLDIKEFICSQNKRPTFTTPINETYRNMIERCWSKETTSRPTFDEILQELRTNPKFITDEIDKDDYFEYISFLDEYPFTYDPTKRFDQFDKLIATKINTFRDIESIPHLSDMHETETNDISFDYNYLNIDHCKTLPINKGHFYEAEKVLDKITREVLYVAKYPYERFDETFESYVRNFSKELTIISQLEHPSILKFIGYDPIYLYGRTLLLYLNTVQIIQ